MVLLATGVASQPVLERAGSRVRQLGNTITNSSGSQGDSLTRRNKLEDSITIRYRYLDSTSNYKLDSSVNDYTIRYPLPAHYVHLGNIGTASRSLLFSPIRSSGFDPGFHSFDIYKWTVEQARFFNTTRPYTELNYLLASRAEQIIDIMHTQNIKPNWNFLFQYRLINSPGTFRNQKTNHNNYLFTTWYQSVNKRYNLYGVLVGNKLQSAESGGMQDTADFLNNPNFDDRFNIPTKIGGNAGFSTDFFNTTINTGTKYSLFTLHLRQQYDLGKKDSLVTDSTVIPLFYPRLRFEHDFRLTKDKYLFQDIFGADFISDSTYYDTVYNRQVTGDSIILRERWTNIINDFSIYQFPDARNQHQFIKLGLALQNLKGEFTSESRSFFNVWGHAEYRNRTRNQAWDIEANGKLYFTGLNAGDYNAYISLQRLLGKKIGYLQLGFENINRTPSFVFDERSSFYLDQTTDLKKENTTHLFAGLYLPSLNLRLRGDYYLLTNYTYFREVYKINQADGLFNVLRVTANKTFRVGRSWRWHTDIYFQQVIGDAPVNLPLVFTRNRFGYEGNLGFPNLNIAIGTEIRYHTPYKPDGYSPLHAQFFWQDSVRISNRPDIAAYLQFRIKGIKFYLRAENLNAANFSEEFGFGFTRNNLTTPGYAMPGLQIRFGIMWSFVN